MIIETNPEEGGKAPLLVHYSNVLGWKSVAYSINDY
jgi:hypothetical protein